MATELFVTRDIWGGLKGADPASADVLRALDVGKTYRVSLTAPRNVRHHRLFFALLQAVYEALPDGLFPTFEHFVDGVKIGIGHCDRYSIGGIECVKPRSISFAAMDQVSFKQFYDRAVTFLLEKVLPGLDRDELNAHIEYILGERIAA